MITHEAMSAFKVYWYLSFDQDLFYTPVFTVEPWLPDVAFNECRILV